MAAIITYHSSGDSPRFGTGHEMPLRPRQKGNMQSLAVSGVANNAAAVSDDCIARVMVEENCWILAGFDAAVTTINGMPMIAGSTEEFWLRDGERISVIAR